MPSLIDLRRRIRAVKNTQQITKAMKMVAASKLRRAQDRVINARPYAVEMQRVLRSVASRVDPSIHPLLTSREITAESRTLVIVVTADKGLCGSFNTNVIKAGGHFVLEQQAAVHARPGRPQGPRLFCAPRFRRAVRAGRHFPETDATRTPARSHRPRSTRSSAARSTA